MLVCTLLFPVIWSNPTRVNRVLRHQQPIPFSSKEAKFSVSLPPGFPAFKVNETRQPSGDITITYQSQTDRGMCALESNLSQQLFAIDRADEAHEAGRNAILERVKGTLEKEERITIQRFPGLRVYISATRDGRQVYLRAELVLTSHRSYIIGYLAYSKADRDSAEIEAYFSSFRIDQ